MKKITARKNLLQKKASDSGATIGIVEKVAIKILNS